MLNSMGQGFTFNREGLSGIITVILIILISIIGISIIWLFVQPAIVDIIGSGGESGEIQKFPECLDNRLEVSGCGAMESGYYEVVVKRFGEGEISEIVFKFTTANDEFTIRNDTVPGAFGSAKYRFNLSSYTLETIESVEVAPILDVGACEFSSGKSCGGVITQEGFCGDGEINEGELCDGENLRELTCEDLDYISGILSCNLDCTFNVTQCMDTGIRTDEDYLLDADVNVFLGSNGETFTVDYQGMRLRQNYSDEAFYSDSSGALEISYDIIEQRGGVDVVYWVYNPTQSTQRVPEFRIDGILISRNINDNVQYLKTKSSAGFQNIDPVNLTYIDRYYPTNYYSPVIVLRDKDYTAGSSLQYPYLDYKQSVRSSLTLISNQNSPRYNTWSHRYRDFTTEPDGANALLQPSDNLTYTLSLRFSEPRNWIFTLYPYKQYFNSLYGASSGSISDRDRRPVLGKQLGDSGGTNCNAGNQRCYRNFFNVGRVDNLGWGPFTDWFISTALTNNYERVLIWTPGGVFNESRGLNYPPQFMSDWLPYVAGTDGNFTKYAQNGIELGFWWGRSNEIPVPVQWNPSNLENADYENPAHITFLTNELEIAEQRGARMIGLDAFTQMPVYQRVLWIDDMKRNAPNMVFTHESTGPDIMHRKLANHADPATWGDINAPDLLAWYLNPDSEIYVLGRGAYNNLAFMQEMSKWGFTPNPKDIYDLDANQIYVDLIECFDGIDNDNDGYTDIYDLDSCVDETGTSEN